MQNLNIFIRSFKPYCIFHAFIYFLKLSTSNVLMVVYNSSKSYKFSIGIIITKYDSTNQ